MTEAFTGSCLCGEIAFKLIGDVKAFYTCHCNRCQKVSGASNAANIFVSSATLEWIKGGDQITTFALSPDTYFNTSFCRRCGAPVPRQARSGNFIIVPAGCLDTGPTLNPDRTIFWDNRAPWFEAAGEAERFRGYDGKSAEAN